MTTFHSPAYGRWSGGFSGIGSTSARYISRMILCCRHCGKTFLYPFFDNFNQVGSANSKPQQQAYYSENPKELDELAPKMFFKFPYIESSSLNEGSWESQDEQEDNLYPVEWILKMSQFL